MQPRIRRFTQKDNLRLDLGRVFATRNITRRFTSMKKLGFSNTTISRFLKDRFRSNMLRYLGQLCLALNCTPNDLLSWAGRPEELPAGHELHKLIHAEVNHDIHKKLHTASQETIEGVLRLLEQNEKKVEA